MSQHIKQLTAHTIPLVGKHLIEASAGTGKTYNITRLYLRFIIERKLTVEQILVMTFTKDATEELRGRIDNSIREAINGWDELVQSDDYFKALATKIDKTEALTLLKKALLYLDEAAIFTIHGFCKRVLSQHAFATGMTFNAEMESDCHELVIEASEDFYRYLAKENAENFTLLAKFWSTPHQFVAQFASAIKQKVTVEVLSADYFINQFIQQAQKAYTALTTEHSYLFEKLVDKHKDKLSRRQEYQALIDWLTGAIDDIELAKTPLPNAFYDGRRYSKNKEKETISAIFSAIKEVEKLQKKLTGNIEKAAAFAIVHQGVLTIRQTLEDKKRQLNQISFDDLISKLAQALVTDQTKQLAQILFEQYPVALVDEFQDTDPQQFAILEAIYFQQKHSALYLIGDPKQAIYAFRGGDIFAYLAARKHCDHQWLMNTNWRSCAAMITGYNRLFWGNDLALPAQAVFGFDIPYSQVKVSPKGDKILPIEPHYNALQFIHFNECSTDGTPITSKQSLRPVMANWCAEEIQRLLSLPSEQGNLLQAKDIAILVRDGTEAAEIKMALLANGLSSVYLSDRENLLKSNQASQLISVLKGILFVEDERLFSAAIANPLMGFSPQRFYTYKQDQQQWQQLKFMFSDLRKQWQQKSFISMALTFLQQHAVIKTAEKDRILTNLIHLFELLQQASQRYKDGQALLYWFEQQVNQDTPEVEAQLRLESDESLIKIVTQHGSKGLEYPIVFIPFASRHKDPLKFGNKSVALINYHDNQGKLRVSLDGADSAKKAMKNEAYAETVRLLYVAVTRAEQRCYVLTANFEQVENSPLGRTLKWQKQVDIAHELSQLAQQQPAAIGVDIIDINADTLTNKQTEQVTISEGENTAVKAAEFSGKIERNWWLSSFSSLHKNIRYSTISAPDRDSNTANATELMLEKPISTHLRFNLAKGAHTGNLLHNILEQADFSAPNWPETIVKPLAHYGELISEGKNVPQEKQVQSLIDWLDDIINTPLSKALNEQKHEATVMGENNLALSALSLTDTLRESEFYFPMNQVKAQQLTALLSEHRQQFNRQPNMTSLYLPSYHKLHGMMHGFIDLIFHYEGKFYLADYKSNYLGDDFTDYHNEHLVNNIEKNHYDLQYLIYALALHRYLKQRVDNYKVSEHFGGVYYLYLRGMTTQKAHQGSGIFYRAISEETLNKLDKIFNGNGVALTEHYNEK
jgi:exodeoxyribonuclease V beta subunit